MVRYALLVTAFFMTAVYSLAQETPDRKPLIGFDAETSARQLRIEEIFSSIPTPDSSRRQHRILTEEPHVAGTPQQRRVAEHVLKRFLEAGISAEIVEYQVLLPYPKRLSVKLVEPEEIELSLQEEGYPVDKDSFSRDVILPFHAYSPSASIEGQIVYVNYGLPEDYQKLEEHGIDVGGKIVLARYGQSFRGVKVRVAEERGAAGVLIYSDPMDDGYFRGDVYPEGPMRPPSGIQRGSVEYLFVYPGDPLTPGRAARGEVERLSLDEAANIPRIPSQPLSYREASKILAKLGGPVVPEGWQGALAFTYHMGPGPSRVRLDLEMDFSIRPVWNVIGRIPGTEFPDEWVILGNHIDAWTYGGVDPSSGTTVLLELVRGMGKLLQDGFQPRRSIVLAGWGGEEFGLIGSTEWGEDLREELILKAVAYLNVDSAVSGSRFGASAAPPLADLIREVTTAVRDPKSRRTIYQTWLESQRKASGDEPLSAPRVGDLGSGSDYTVFLDHLGIASLSMGFGGPYGVYHALYDTHHWMDRFGDPGWQYHPVMAEIWGRTALRLANAEVLPLGYSGYGKAIQGYLDDLKTKIDKDERLVQLRELLLGEARSMERIGAEIRQGTERLLVDSRPRKVVSRINELLRQAERGFLIEAGLPNRPWFRHSIYAPGFYTGYASQPLPGLAQALDQGNTALARQQAEVLLRKLKKVNRTLDQIRRLTR